MAERQFMTTKVVNSLNIHHSLLIIHLIERHLNRARILK